MLRTPQLRRDGNARVPSLALVLALLALFTSTTFYFIYTILSTQTPILRLLLFSAQELPSLTPAQVSRIPKTGLFTDYSFTQECVRTSALSVNVCSA